MKKDNLSAQTNPHLPSVFQLVFSVLAILILWGLSLILALMGLGQLTAVKNSAGSESMLMMAFATFTASLLLIPSAGFSLGRLMGWNEILSFRTPRWLNPNLFILTFPVVLLLGYLAGQAPDLAWLVLPPLHVLAIGLPVWWLLYQAIRHLPSGSRQRVWGVFGSGLVLAPWLILIFEGMALLIAAVAAAFFIASQPELLKEFRSFSEWWSTANPTQEEALETLTPYILKPTFIFSAIFFASVLVPIIEEIFKPIGVWLLLRKKMTPGAGFALGAVSGAGYAMFESMAISLGPEGWPQLVVMRIGTAVIHIFNSAMMGWALSQVWHRRRYLRLALVFLGVVSLHGFWNGLTLVSSFAGLAVELPGLLTTEDLLFYIQIASGSILILLVIGVCGAGLLFNRRLEKGNQSGLDDGINSEMLPPETRDNDEQSQSNVL